MIRSASVQDLPRLQDIERAAGGPFRDIGMAAVADDEPPTLEDLRGYEAAGRAWVACDDEGLAVAYLLVDVIDEAAHVEQVSVHPDHARRGLGRALIDTAARWAMGQGLEAVTLTTFAQVPWNAPYYSRLGFVEVSEADIGPGVRALREDERDKGLDAWPRIVMRRRLDATGRLPTPQ